MSESNSKYFADENVSKDCSSSFGKFTYLGADSSGGKASGLQFIKNILEEQIDHSKYPDIEIGIPNLIVLKSSFFDAFMERNNLYEIAYSDEPDDRIAHAFVQADLPIEILGELRSLIKNMHTPLAVRSSSMLEDRKEEPFAGIYATKMIANNQTDTSTRFNQLIEAVKFVYASTYFKAAKDYLQATNHSFEEEKMAVIIQDVVGSLHNKRFYPEISGVARSYNYYPMGKSKPEDGVINLALGLGKTIVEGGISWTYTPKFPKASPPFANPKDMIKNTQSEFWAVNMESITKYDPINETEYLIKLNLGDAEYDGTFKYSASTFNAASDKVTIGVGIDGPRILNFGTLLVLNEFNINNLMTDLLRISENAYNNPVEIEFAICFDHTKNKMNFGFLQVRPMMVSTEEVEVAENEFESKNLLLASRRVLGNGTTENLLNIVYIKPEIFETKFTRLIAAEIDELNKDLLKAKTPYLLIGFGRWGSSDPWLGIPVDWGQIAGAKVIVESTLPGINVELSQGSHFFHNITSFKVNYFSLHHESEFQIDWDWLNSQLIVTDKKYVRHIKLKSPLKVKVDGRTGKGVIVK